MSVAMKMREMNDWKISNDTLKLGVELGRGSFGIVMCVTRRPTVANASFSGRPHPPGSVVGRRQNARAAHRVSLSRAAEWRHTPVALKILFADAQAEDKVLFEKEVRMMATLHQRATGARERARSREREVLTVVSWSRPPSDGSCVTRRSPLLAS